MSRDQRVRYPPVALALLSALFLPLLSFVVLLSNFVTLLDFRRPSDRGHRTNSTRRKLQEPHRKIIITAAERPAALCLARIFAAHGIPVTGVVYGPRNSLSPARWSRAYSKVRYANQQKLAEAILSEMNHDTAEILWIPCESSIDLEAIKRLPSILPLDQAKRLWVLQPHKDLSKQLNKPECFAHLVNDSNSNIRAPHIYEATTRTEVHRILGSAAPGTRFMLRPAIPGKKSVHFVPNDSDVSLTARPNMSRARTFGEVVPAMGTVERVNSADFKKIFALPHQDLNETHDAISTLNISSSRPWTMHEILEGDKHLAHALVVNGIVRTFVVTVPSNSKGSKAWLLPPGTALHKALLSSMQYLAQSLGATTHLTVAFLVNERMTPKGPLQEIYAINCSTSPDQALALLSNDPQAIASICDAYMSIFAHDTNGTPNGHVEPRPILATPERGNGRGARGLYSLPASFRALLLAPIVQFLGLRGSATEVAEGLAMLVEKMVFWKEETFTWADPGPWVANLAMSTRE